MHISFSDRGGEPPTPTKTPTSATFLQTSFETPKQESSFYDPRVTWNTADPCATSPDFLKTPRYLAFATPKGSPSSGDSSRKRRFSGQNIDDEIASHVHHASPNSSLQFPLVEPSRQLSSAPNPSQSSSSTKRSNHRPSKPASTPLKLHRDEELEPTMRSAGSMQTPPPTSTSASRRKSQQTQTAKLAKQSAASARRKSTPIVPKTKAVDVMSGHIEDSPLQLGSLQFSPDGFGFPLSGPATAPIYPQQKLFWDPDQNTDGMNIDFSTEDPFTLSFGLGTQKGLDPFISLGEQTSASELQASSFNLFNPQSSHVTDLAMSLDPDAANQVDFLNSSGLMIRGTSTTKFPGKGVNPSLLFSSPSRFPVQSASAQVHPNDTLQPYAHQIGDAQIEDELVEARRAKKRRKPDVDSPAVKAALQTLRDENDLRPEFGENATDRTTFLLRKSRSRKSRVSFQSSETFKKSAQPSRSSIHQLEMARQPKKRPVVTLTIDSHGRAKTETKTVYDDDGSSSNARMEVDTTSDDSETTSSSGSTTMILSRPQSFDFPNRKQKNPKLARFATDSKTHSQKSSYASTLASGNNANILPLPENQNRPRITGHASSLDGLAQSHSKNFIHPASSPTTISDDMNNMRDNDRIEIESEAETLMTSDDDQGDAQYELKKIIRNRAHDRAAIRSGLKKGQISETQDHDSRPDPMPPRDYSGSLPPSGRARNPYDNISPTTITDPDLTTPSTGRESHVSDTTRCVCHVSEIEGELMILW